MNDQRLGSQALPLLDAVPVGGSLKTGVLPHDVHESWVGPFYAFPSWHVPLEQVEASLGDGLLNRRSRDCNLIALLLLGLLATLDAFLFQGTLAIAELLKSVPVQAPHNVGVSGHDGTRHEESDTAVPPVRSVFSVVEEL